ncbi:hypothetical protein G6F22_015531 [Rhizopus arrhizus]|nr:hypothetical protein G6F22_015531 [Rhizopus arrhizus]
MAAGAGTVGVAGAGARAAALGHHRAAVDRAADVAGIVAAGNAVAEPDRWRGRRADRRHPTLWYSRGVAVVAAVRAGAGVRRGQPGGSRTRTGSGRCAADAGRRPAGRAAATHESDCPLVPPTRFAPHVRPIRCPLVAGVLSRRGTGAAGRHVAGAAGGATGSQAAGQLPHPLHPCAQCLDEPVRIRADGAVCRHCPDLADQGL